MKRFLTLLLAAGCTVAAQAQIRLGDGQLTGSFETNTIYYVDDNGLGEAGKAPKDHFGSNNYLKADYTYGRFSAGLQADAYLPALQGYEIGQQPGGHKFYLSSKYIQWQDKNFSVLVGDIFDQFGNGLIYRSYEDRQLGFNNSVEGIRGIYRFGSFVELKGPLRPSEALYRLHRFVGARRRSEDLDRRHREGFGAAAHHRGQLREPLRGARQGRVRRLRGAGSHQPQPEHVLGPSESGLERAFAARGEYAVKSTDLSSLNQTEAMKGHASLVELGYYYKGFSFSGQFRELDHMGTLLSLYGNGTGNTLNYLPALTRQYTYMLANLNPYQVNVEGEIGGQVDVYYTWRNPSNRHRYWNFHANYSTFYTRNLSQTASSDRHELLWRDANFDIERQWNRTWKTTILYSFQEWNPITGRSTAPTCRTSSWLTSPARSPRSLRCAPRCSTCSPTSTRGDWVAGLLEYNLAPRWSIFFQDMYNLDATAANNYEKINYYSGGFSYTKSRTRIQLSYGRNRAGYICSGGVCRYSPAYTGVNLAITSSF